MTKTKASAIDMSPLAIQRRLEQVRALNRLCRYLGEFRIVGPVEAPTTKR